MEELKRAEVRHFADVVVWYIWESDYRSAALVPNDQSRLKKTAQSVKM